MIWTRSIRRKIKNEILVEQDNKCANSPTKPAINLADYKCLLWKYGDGVFDEAGYAIDHIDEYCKTRNSDRSNLQALCPNCHAVKTRRFQKNKKLYTSTELSVGRALMVIDTIKKNKKRKIL